MNKTNPSSNLDALMLQAVSLHQGGHLSHAKSIYDQVLKIDENHYDALHYLGILLAQSGRPIEAEAWIRKAISIKGEDEKAFNNLGLILQDLDRASDALVCYQKAMLLNPVFLEAHFNCANVLLVLKQYEESVQAYEKVIQLKPDYAEAYNNRGNALGELEKNEAAIASYKIAVKLNPEYAECFYNLSLELHHLGQNIQALEACQKACSLDSLNPEMRATIGVIQQALNENDLALIAYDQAIQLSKVYPEAHFNLACLLQKIQRYDAAIESYSQAIAIKPDYEEAYNNLGNVLQHLQRYDAAIESYSQAIAIKPDYAEAYNNLGNVLQHLQRYDAAIESYSQAIAIKPDYADGFFNRGNANYRAGRQQQALDDYSRALEFDPNSAEAKWALTISSIPPMIRGEQELEQSRQKFYEELISLDGWFNKARQDSGYRVVGSRQPFYLAYQDKNNQALLGQYGKLCTRLMRLWQNNSGLSSPKKSSSKKIRIGIVSNHIHDHSVWNAIIKGWVSELSKNTFELNIFYLGSLVDDETRFAQARANTLIDPNKTFSEWAKTIHEYQIDILIYPELGMHQESLQLASLRLAPLQIASWGHPETTGLDTIDHYFSAELMEGGGAQNHYVENLVELPHIGCYYFPLRPQCASLDFNKLGLDPTRPILLCPGTPYKYLEKYDSVFPEIATKLKNCQLVFFTKASWSAFRLEERLRCKFKLANLQYDEHVNFIPWLNREEFFSLMNQATVYLDTIGFSGFNTAMQAIECNLPIVTMRSQFLRGNLAAAPLNQMGLNDLIADDEQGYVDQVVKLVTNDLYRTQVRGQIEIRKEILFEDKTVIEELELFLIAKHGLI